MAKRKGPPSRGPGSPTSDLGNGNASTFGLRQQREFDTDSAWFQRNSRRPYRVRRAVPGDLFYDRFGSDDPAVEKWLVVRPDTSWRVITVLSGGRR